MNDSSYHDLYAHLRVLGRSGHAQGRLDATAPELVLVESGHVDVFLLLRKEASVGSARHHLLRADAGQLLALPAAAAQADFTLLAVAGMGAEFRLLDYDECVQAFRIPRWHDDVEHLLDTTVRGLADAIEGGVPGASETIAGGARVEVPPDVQDFALSPASEDCWFAVSAGAAVLMDHAPIAYRGYLPLPSNAWLRASGGACLDALSTRDACRGQIDVLGGLRALTLLLAQHRFTRILVQEKTELERLQRKVQSDEKVLSRALGQFAGLLDNAPETDLAGGSGDRLLDACRLVGAPLDIRFKALPAVLRNVQVRDPVSELADVSGVRNRIVALHDGWWTCNQGPILGFGAEDGEAIALLPVGQKAYVGIDPTDGERIPLDAAFAASLQPFGRVFYRGLPPRKLEPRDLVAFVAFGLKRELLTVFVVGLLGGLLSLAVPMGTGYLFERVYPAADRSQMVQVTLLLFVCALVTLLFNAMRSFTMLRIESTAGAELQSAVWDRLLSLPVTFFRNYKAGDLAARINGINDMRRLVSGTVVTTLLSSLFSVFNAVLLFYYSPSMASTAVVLVLVAVAVNAVIAYRRVTISRDASTIAGNVGAQVFDYLRGIAKLRTSGSEWRAFRNWAGQFAIQKRMQLAAGAFNNASIVFGAVYPVVCTMVMFSLIVWQTSGPAALDFSAGKFIAFYAAFTALLTAMLAMVRSCMDILDVVPLYERTKPIWEAIPEKSSANPHPGELRGGIEVSNLKFSYAPDTPLILDNVSLTVRPGEFVALVGSSGSGKSTLLRLLLGFEKPTQGGIYYDGSNIEDVDIASVRRQLGVVLQSGNLMDGDIFTNIIGSTSLTLSDAWEAARACGLDQDIEKMPMGMHTLVTGGTISGGQRQRLLIARAIVSRPRILYFDEATSALDNRTQAIVSASIEKLHATRVVIAHRLSTIINADCIYVLDKGKIVQSGTYEELMREEGLFVELARRQLA
jgi:NHLM bacteriocin system ABC transporter ATP-binding protein